MNAPASSLGRLSDRLDRDTGWWRLATLAAALALLLGVGFGAALLLRDERDQLINPATVALVLVIILIPAIALLVLLASRAVRHRARRQKLGSGHLQTRLVALFSVIAAVPTVLVAIFASILFQSGIEFWFSDRARTVLSQAERTAQIYSDEHRQRLKDDLQAMGLDVVDKVNAESLNSVHLQGYIEGQTLIRQFRETALFAADGRGGWRSFAKVDLDQRNVESSFAPADAMKLKAGEVLVRIGRLDRIEGLIRLDPNQPIFLYGARSIDGNATRSLLDARQAASAYRRTLERARGLQLQFNGAILFGSLLMVALSIVAALKLADRLLRPVETLVDAAGRIEAGDYSARVPDPPQQDEIGTLSAAFNRMTGRIADQRNALIEANEQIETRRAFIEAVLSSVSAGVVAVDKEGHILLTNQSAAELLAKGGDALDGRDLADVAPELDRFSEGKLSESHLLVQAGEGQRTLAVKRLPTADGTVLTFDDITDHLADQRRAAWSDIARRIAHEIKNPLTPIQLAAERLQRRYGKEIDSDPDTFQRLTDTIVRQVGDLRRMVDEFSNFARMPKPEFAPEDVHDIARGALFLHEVAHPDIDFSMTPATGPVRMICDRRQLSQALTNIIKNAVEAIHDKHERDGAPAADAPRDRVALALVEDGGQQCIDVADTGIGLPDDRAQLTEPYVTTRARGTGLGLAIVKKIVEEHGGTIGFCDRDGGGTRVRIAFDRSRLASLAGDPAPEIALKEEMR